jgi:hypothetical protein
MSVPVLEQQHAHRFEGVHFSQHPLQGSSSDKLLSLNAAEQALGEAFINVPEPPTVDHMEQIVRDLGTSAQLGRLVTEIVSNPARLKLVAAASEKHPLGFDKIPLLWADSAYQLRMNIWPASPGEPLGPAEEDIHEHQFDFASKIFLGKLATRLYEFTEQGPIKYPTIPLAEAAVADDPDEAERALNWHYRQLDRIMNGQTEEHEPKPVSVFRARSRGGATHEAMAFEGPGFARLASQHIILEAGEIYSLVHDTYHRAYQVSDAEPTATLFLRGGTVVDSNVIARKPLQEHVDSTKPKIRLTEYEVVKALTGLFDKQSLAMRRARVTTRLRQGLS